MVHSRFLITSYHYRPTMDFDAVRKVGGSARSSIDTVLRRQREIVTGEYNNLPQADKVPGKPMWSDLSQQEIIDYLLLDMQQSRMKVFYQKRMIGVYEAHNSASTAASVSDSDSESESAELNKDSKKRKQAEGKGE